MKLEGKSRGAIMPLSVTTTSDENNLKKGPPFFPSPSSLPMTMYSKKDSTRNPQRMIRKRPDDNSSRDHSTFDVLSPLKTPAGERNTTEQFISYQKLSSDRVDHYHGGGEYNDSSEGRSIFHHNETKKWQSPSPAQNQTSFVTQENSDNLSDLDTNDWNKENVPRIEIYMANSPLNEDGSNVSSNRPIEPSTPECSTSMKSNKNSTICDSRPSSTLRYSTSHSSTAAFIRRDRHQVRIGATSQLLVDSRNDSLSPLRKDNIVEEKGNTLLTEMGDIKKEDRLEEEEEEDAELVQIHQNAHVDKSTSTSPSLCPSGRSNPIHFDFLLEGPAIYQPANDPVTSTTTTIHRPTPRFASVSTPVSYRSDHNDRPQTLAQSRVQISHDRVGIHSAFHQVRPST